MERRLHRSFGVDDMADSENEPELKTKKQTGRFMESLRRASELYKELPDFKRGVLNRIVKGRYFDDSKPDNAWWRE